MPEIALDYRPNVVQEKIHGLMGQVRFSIIKAHRQAGKTLACVAESIYAALTCPTPHPRAAVVLPQLNMARRNAWDYLRRLASVVPNCKLNETLLTADFPHNGGRVSLFGSDNPDTLRGLHHDFVALDEFALMDPRTWPEVVLPTLVSRHGKATLLGTILTRQDPLFTMYERAATLEGWGRLTVKASESGIVSPEELANARAIMSPSQFAREFELEPSATFDGSVYGAQLDEMDRAGRIGNFPWTPSAQVWSAWDIGFHDLTSITFWQPSGSGWHLIDYEEGAQAPLPYYVKRVKEKPYVYGGHIAPFDIEVTEFSSGQSRLETARQLGIDFVVAPKLSVEEGLDATRRFLATVSINRATCARALECLQAYRFDWLDDLRTFSKRPRHDWSSHCADSVRVFVTGYQDIPDKREIGELKTELNFNPFSYERTNDALNFSAWRTDRR